MQLRACGSCISVRHATMLLGLDADDCSTNLSCFCQESLCLSWCLSCAERNQPDTIPDCCESGATDFKRDPEFPPCPCSPAKEATTCNVILRSCCAGKNAAKPAVSPRAASSLKAGDSSGCAATPQRPDLACNVPSGAARSSTGSSSSDESEDGQYPAPSTVQVSPQTSDEDSDSNDSGGTASSQTASTMKQQAAEDTDAISACTPLTGQMGSAKAQDSAFVDASSDGSSKATALSQQPLSVPASPAGDGSPVRKSVSVCHHPLACLRRQNLLCGMCRATVNIKSLSALAIHVLNSQRLQKVVFLQVSEQGSGSEGGKARPSSTSDSVGSATSTHSHASPTEDGTDSEEESEYDPGAVRSPSNEAS